MGEGGAEHFANGGGGGMGGFPGDSSGGMPFHFTTSGRPGGGGVHHGMSNDEAQQFFSSFFGNDDPFGGFGNSFHHGGRGGGGPSIRMSTTGGGMPSMMSSGGDPFGMYGGGMPMDMSSSFSGGHPMQQQRQSIRRVKRYDALPNGTIVSFKGLKMKAERNGDRGEIQDYEPSSGRYTVLVEDSDELLRVKADNLLQHTHVVLSGIASQPSLNDKSGTIIAWDDDKERYNIYVMSLSKIVSLKPLNVILKNGTVCKIINLISKPQLNGTYGTIKQYVRDSQRYEVQISEQQILRLKLENVVV